MPIDIVNQRGGPPIHHSTMAREGNMGLPEATQLGLQKPSLL